MKHEQPIDEVRQDENGVDLEQLEYNLSLTPAERMRQHYRWRMFVKDIQGTAGRMNGSAADDLKTSE